MTPVVAQAVPRLAERAAADLLARGYALLPACC
jgi:hypothetical protein